MKNEVGFKKETLGTSPFTKQATETLDYTRIFTGTVNSHLLDRLSDKAKSLFLWLIMQLEVDQDYVKINRLKFMEDNKIKSLTTCLDAIKELVSTGILARTVVKNIYWINTKIVFKGNIVNN